jgi:AhpD family alkylhydroperoxidase
VSITNDCQYCINTHTAAARKKGMDDEVLGELNEIVALANAGNRLTSGLQVEVDGAFAQQHKYTEWKAPRRANSKKLVKSPAIRKARTGGATLKPVGRRKARG